jgi:hypothetical protein
MEQQTTQALAQRKLIEDGAMLLFVDEIIPLNLTNIQQCMVNLTWQWWNAKDDSSPRNWAVRSALDEYCNHNREMAWECLLIGQSHKPEVMELYNRTRAQIGEERFWEVVCKSAVHTPSNFNEALANVAFNRREDPAAYNLVKAFFASGQDVKAMFWAMRPQYHNPGVMEKFRACYRDDRNRFAALFT